MKYNELKTLIEESRTARRFKQNSPVNLEELKELLDLSRISSSAMNAQPIKYILVTNKEDVLKLSQTSTWAGNIKEWDQSENERPSAFILMLNDRMIDGFPMFDAGVAFNTISLAAKTKQLAICPLASINKDLCRELFVIPDNLDIMIGIAIGIGNEKIKLVDSKNGGTTYYRLEDETHCVPKRTLQEIIIGEY